MGMFDSIGDSLGMGAGPKLIDLTDAASKVKAVKTDPTAAYNATQMQHAQGPQAAQLDTQQSDQARQYQSNLLGQLAQQSQGQGPSLAGMQLKQAQDQAFAQQQAQLATNRGSFDPGMARQVLQNNMTMNQNLGNQSAQARMQEQLNAQSQLSGTANNVRGQDLSAAQANAGYQQQTGLAGYQGQIGENSQQAQMDQARAQQLFANQAANNQSFADQQFKVNNLQYDAAMASNQQDMAKQQMKNAQIGQAMGAVSSIGAAAAMPGVSDRNAKKDIKPGDAKLTEFLDAINGYTYKYKEGRDLPTGERTSPMAQDLEKSSLGNAFVQDTEKGKVVDYGKGLGTMLAAMGQLHNRLKKVEGK